MRAYFPDTKSASLACEQLVELGLPLKAFTLTPRESTVPAPSGRPAPQHISILDRLSVLFGSRSPTRKISPPPPASSDRGEAILTVHANTLGPEAREIIQQHGGYVEPVPSAS